MVTVSPPVLRTTQGLRGEHRLVTVMFADTSGFAPISEHMDPEAVRDRMNACFDRTL
jgi:class 3 adenylate cyclase